MRGLRGRLNQGGRDCRLQLLSTPCLEEQTKEEPNRFKTGLKLEGEGTRICTVNCEIRKTDEGCERLKLNHGWEDHVS